VTFLTHSTGAGGRRMLDALPAGTRTAFFALASAVVLGATACSVGDGSGTVTGNVFMVNCHGTAKPYCADDNRCGTPTTPVPYDLQPRFFAAEPIEDLRISRRNNRLLIRIQRSGKRTELTDVLTFDVVNTHAVARCVRGRTSAARPDYDVRNCFRPAGGLPRLRVGPDADVRATFIPRATCPDAARTAEANILVAAAVSRARDQPDGAWDSWIELEQFGSAAQNDRAPEAREPVSERFKVDFGQRLQASNFQLSLEDTRVTATQTNMQASPPADIGGTLGGNFDFDLERGQGAQTFP